MPEIKIEWVLPIETLKENNPREELLKYIRQELLQHELTHPIVHERR